VNIFLYFLKYFSFKLTNKRETSNVKWQTLRRKNFETWKRENIKRFKD